MSVRIYVIDKGVPIPPSNTGKARTGRKPLYPFEQMEVNDSVMFTPSLGDTTPRLQSRLANRVRYVNRKSGHQFVTRQVDNGVRV